MGDGLIAMMRRRSMPLVIGGVIVGVLAGLLLGWLVWPVSWYDTDPSDLRLQHQASYVILVSDSLAVTGDIEGARLRLAELTDDDTTWHEVANLVELVAAERESQGDLAAALRLRRMSQAVGMPLATANDFDPRANVRRPAGGLLYGGLAAVIVALGVGGYLYRMRAARPSPRPRTMTPASWLDRVAASPAGGAPPARADRLDLQGEPADASDMAYAEGEDAWEDQTPPTMSIPTRAAPQVTTAPAPTSWVTARPGIGDPYLASVDEDESPGDWEDEDDADLIAVDDDSDTGAEEAAPDAMASAREDAPATRGVASLVEVGDLDAPPDALALFEAEYILGDDDFDASYTIESPDGEFLGECGVTLVDVLDVEGGVQRSDAFEVWLFDKGDIRTVSKVLVSERALHDEARSARLSAKGELVLAEPGGVVLLETNALRVTVTLRDCEFSEGSDGPEGCFVRLDLELLAESSDAVP